MTYAVIGSGPCGAVAALLLLQAGREVVMFDVNAEESVHFEKLSSTLKLMGGSSAPYDIHQLLKVTHKNRNLGFYRSKISGGFSNVWGATWGAQQNLRTENWLQSHLEVTQLVSQGGYLEINPNQVCNCFGFIDGAMNTLPPEVQVRKTLLALNPTICDCIGNGGTSCAHGSVWHSGLLLSRCYSFKNFTFKSDRDVLGLEKNSHRVTVKGNNFSEDFDDVIIAAGTVGTVEILLNSNLGSEVLTLQDTLMGFLPLLKFGVRKKHGGGFAFSQYTLETRFGEQGLVAHAQLYSDAEIYEDRIIGKTPRFIRSLLKPIIDFFLPHIAIAIIYGDAAMSPRIAFRKSVETRGLTADFLSPRNSKRGLNRRLWQVFRKLSFFPLLPLLIWSKPGESYHLGALENSLLDEYGSVKSISGIHVAGAVSLPSVDPGPITHSAMAQTSRLIEHLTTKT